MERHQGVMSDTARRRLRLQAFHPSLKCGLLEHVLEISLEASLKHSETFSVFLNKQQIDLTANEEVQEKSKLNNVLNCQGLFQKH